MVVPPTHVNSPATPPIHSRTTPAPSPRLDSPVLIFAFPRVAPAPIGFLPLSPHFSSPRQCRDLPPSIPANPSQPRSASLPPHSHSSFELRLPQSLFPTANSPASIASNPYARFEKKRR